MSSKLSLYHSAHRFIPRETFPSHNVVLAKFPGHHRAALYALRQLAFQIDLVLELRDARAPISTINPLLDHVLPGKPKIVLYTKSDISPLKHSVIQSWDPNQEFLRIQSDLRKDARRVFKAVMARVSKELPLPPLGYRVLVTGMPNVGKSTFLNVFRKVGMHNIYLKPVARTGNTPGVTRSVSEVISLCDDPKIYGYDTPGVFVPQATTTEMMMNLCLINTVNYRNVIEPTVLADYLLYHLNKRYPLGGRYPGNLTNSIDKALDAIAKTGPNKQRRANNLTTDPNTLATNWIQQFSNGGIGKLCLDDTSVEAYQEAMRRNKEVKLDLGDHRPERALKKQYMM